LRTPHALRDYANAHGLEPIADIVADGDLSWARLYFDSSPARHAAAWRRLAGFGDDSQTYYWRVLAAKEIMRLYRHDRDKLKRHVLLQNAKASAEEVLHPPTTTRRFHDPSALEARETRAAKKTTPRGRLSWAAAREPLWER
jgi:hypothetical protein